MYIAKTDTLEVFKTNYPDAVKEAQDLANTYRCKAQVVPVGQDIPIYETTPRTSALDWLEVE
jgi:hypothetical protein